MNQYNESFTRQGIGICPATIRNLAEVSNERGSFFGAIGNLFFAVILEVAVIMQSNNPRQRPICIFWFEQICMSTRSKPYRPGNLLPDQTIFSPLALDLYIGWIFICLTKPQTFANQRLCLRSRKCYRVKRLLSMCGVNPIAENTKVLIMFRHDLTLLNSMMVLEDYTTRIYRPCETGVIQYWRASATTSSVPKYFWCADLHLGINMTIRKSMPIPTFTSVQASVSIWNEARIFTSAFYTPASQRHT